MTHASVRTQVVGLVLWLALTFVVAALASIASIEADSFYLQLVRPTWAPPGWLFGPVWSVLYTAMAVAVWLVWRERGAPLSVPAMVLFVLQLAANAMWSWLFFGWHRGALAFVDVVLLFLLIAATLTAFWRVSRIAGALLIPYLAWVGFASVLTWWEWQNNPGIL
jgi:tryptophan-rich sensory protein